MVESLTPSSSRIILSPLAEVGNATAFRLRKIYTSHVERSNLTVRMQVRRMTRLTNGLSKKWENHESSLGLFFAHYNYCRPHQTLTGEAKSKTTPAMASGLTDRVWTVEDLLLKIGRL